MTSFTLNIETIASLNNFHESKEHIFAIYRDYVYFINVGKLDKILSLMRILYEFNDFQNSTGNKNITIWLKNRKLLTLEILEEIKYYKICCDVAEDFSSISGFWEQFIVNEETFSGQMNSFLKESIKNLILFDYLKTNQDKFNEYLNRLLNFFEHNPQYLRGRELYFNFFVDCVIEAEKNFIRKRLCKADDLYISFSSNKNLSKYFHTGKIYNKNMICFRELIRKNQILSFDITYNSENIFPFEIEKYFQLAEYTNKIRYIKENQLLKVKCSNVPLKQDYSEKYPVGSNYSFLSKNQIFYFCLESEILEKINSLLICPAESEIFYFNISEENKFEFLNYAKIN